MTVLLERAAHDVSDEPRDDRGRWTDGGGGSDGGGATKPAGAKHPGAGYSKNAWVDSKGVIHTSNVYDAQRALFEDRKVELKQIKQVSTLIKRLGETAAEMSESGEKAPVFNLCNVSVEGTNLFCAEQKGIKRVEMPVIPAKRTKEFIKYLKSEGYKVEKDNERAANLRATQSEIDGAKVATQMERIRKEGFYKRLVISKDDYILDGHHTWAGQLGIDAQDNNLKDEKSVKIARVDIDIISLIKEADKWTTAQGIAKKPAGAASYTYISLREAISVLDAETYAKYADVAYRFFTANGQIAAGFDDVMIALDTRAREPREQTEIELWPEEDENEDDFMDRCTAELEVCIGDRAFSVCADKWEASKELGKKGYVTLDMLSGDLAIAPCGTSCLGCRGVEQKWDEGQHPREPAGSSEGGRFTEAGGGGGGGGEGGYSFVSPNVSNIGLAIAHSALAGERQKALAQASGEIDRVLGISSSDHHIIGAWKDGAENSLMSVSAGTSWDKLRLSGAMKGYLGDQKQVLLFRDQKEGAAALYKWDVKGDVQDVHDKLLTEGLAFHTLEPHTGGVTVYVADLDGSLHDAVAKASGAAPVEYRLGQAEFIGTTSETGSDREQRDDARRAYEEIIGQSPVQGSREAWDRFRNRWGEELKKPHPLTADSIMAEAAPAKRRSLAIVDVAKQLNARAGHFLQEQFGKSSIEESSPETDEYLADAIAEDLKAGLTNGQASPTWYSDKTAAAMKIAERMHPELATNADKRFAYIAALAVTSQGEVVDSNVRLAEEAYSAFSTTGKFPTDLEAKKQKSVNGNMNKLNKLVARFGLKGTKEFFDKEMTVRELEKITGYKVVRTGKDEIVNGSAVLGPKIGLGFYQNLMGNFKPLTMDMWFMRSWGRMTNTGVGQPDMGPISERLRNALKDEGRKAPAGMEALSKVAEEVYDAHEKDYAAHSDEYKSGKRDKSELAHAAERFVLSYGGKLVEAPLGVEQRAFINTVFARALDKLESKYGIRLTPAAAQATWWNPEKVLYEHLGGRTKDTATDYEKSMRKYEETHGPGPLSAAA